MMKLTMTTAGVWSQTGSCAGDPAPGQGRVTLTWRRRDWPGGVVPRGASGPDAGQVWD